MVSGPLLFASKNDNEIIKNVIFEQELEDSLSVKFLTETKLIPAFNASGVIPPFVASPTNRGGSPYGTDLQEIASVLVNTEERKEIFVGLLEYRKALRSIGVTTGFQLIDGSFTENCEKIRGRSPKDVDLVTFAYLPVTGPEVRTFFEKNIELFDQDALKEKYKCDAYFVDLAKDSRIVVEDTMYWYGLFSHQRETNLWKGNLEVKHSNPRNIYMSTLDQADIDVMKATKTCVSAQRFQYDYLNDDITEDGKIDYSLSNKVPQGLRDAIAAGKKILVLINPPYGESANTLNKSAKTDIATTNIAKTSNGQGYANRELFTQFVVRIQREIPSATLAMFSKLKYVNAPNFEIFRANWSAHYLGGFVVHSKAFDGLSGNFPIGFLVWKTQSQPGEFPTQIQVDVLNRDAQAIGEKLFHNISKDRFLNNWIQRPRSNAVDALPLKNALSPTTSTKDVRGTKWADGAIGSMLCDSNDLQGAGQGTALLSSGFCSAGAFFVTSKNLWQAAVVFAVRRLIKPTWLNDRDQFLQPTEPLTEVFKTDCLLWMLFNGSNLTASADDLEWNGKKWSIVNHFIPYSEAEVDAPDRFESDFMVQYLADKTLSEEAQAVLDAGRELWKSYFAHTDVRTVRDQFKLNRSDVGWYQIRKALAERNKSGDTVPVNFTPFEAAYETLTEKLRPQVFDLGFLK